uniref:Heat shock factor 1 n=1 Tax=Sinonovacula constricta TaxID=98310 RepID=A0A7G4WEM6_SINCO|nr:heat shock factor 1 [Sinonovacula constricta]
MDTSQILASMGVTNIPAFLTKIWTLVEDPNTDDLIAWDPSGLSFHIYDQIRFSKEILPMYFKHNNIASFIRQLNMYGFRKVVHVESGILKSEQDDLEFHHPYFLRGQEEQLENIKRKPSGQGATVSHVKTEHGLELNSADVSRVLNDVQMMKGKQESFSNKMDRMKKENEALWREVASLRQKHLKQQQIVNKLIQFMIHLVGGNRTLSTGLQKRKLPLMINDTSQVAAAKRPRHNKTISIEELQDYVVKSPPSVNSNSPSKDSGLVIQDITDLIDASEAQTSLPTAASPSSQPLPTNYTSPLVSRRPGQLAINNTVTEHDASKTDPIKVLTDNTVDILGSSLDSTDLNNLVDNHLMSDMSSIARTSSSPSPSSSALTESANSNILDRYMKENPIPARVGSANSIVLPNELSGHLDMMQDEIDNLKDLLSGGQYSFDPNTLMNLFNSEQASTNIENLLGDIDTSPLSFPTSLTDSHPDPNTITGNELVQFMPHENLLPICPDLSECISDEEGKPAPESIITTRATPVSLDNILSTPANFIDCPISPTITEIDPMSFINVIPQSDKSSET